MRRFLAAILAFCMVGFITPAVAEGTFHGEWQQVSSNAGDCATCRLTIHQSGASLWVVANND